jgi:flavin-dependent dehydrogenase
MIMPDINVEKLVNDILAAATGAAKGHATDLKGYLEARAKIIADGVQTIITDRLQEKITDDDVRFAFEQIKASEATSLLAIAVTLKAAAQDAINAAISVAEDAVNKAIGITMF